MGKDVGNWDQRKDVDNDENMTKCARSAVMLDGKIFRYVDIYKELHRDVHHHPIYSRFILMTW